ncbi:MAG: hypothetical protein DRO67_01245 [Candidatus Asgardarchaeum californiense]|nr:MAG: hypothetical protein DRO67_01245 [Candidatus Asgardarchaeum californiense]
MTSEAVLAMPILVPLPIETYGQPWYKRTYRWLFGKRKWKLAENFYYNLDGHHIYIPAGFVTDFASIPRPFWPLLSPVGIMMIPGLMHDWYYRNNYFLSMDDNGTVHKVFVGLGRKYADSAFKKVGKEVNGMVVPNVVAWVVLDLCGWFPWKRYRKNRMTV